MKLKITFNSPVVLCFIIICFVATILNYITMGASNTLLFSTYHSALTNPMTYVRFITYIFGHADISHFAGNAMYILLLGPMLEEKYGSKMLIIIMGITAVITALINYVLFPNIALCGASGIVFAFILLTSFTGFKQGEIPLTFILVAIVFIGQQIVEGITIQDNVSNLSHIIGGIIGTVIGYVLNKSK
ncbi:MAG: rhomboid family intramembrane serine protease [Butyrivibrio sp.]|nr:rhomboid family intramembrane serine protease [Butyrivibrio sp.]